MTARTLQLLLLTASLLALGCDRESDFSAPAPSSASSPSAPSPTKILTRGSNTLTGKVILTGFTPSPKTQSVACTSHAHINIPDESVVMGADGALANVIVYLKNVSTNSPTDLPPAVLDQINCRYVPHVLALQVGQTLTVKSSDNTLHNVHALTDINKSFNFGMNGKATRDLTFTHPETFRIKCDVHPWMSAHLAVFNHPFFSVTAPDGSFKIENLPPGAYTLAAWHEKFDTLEQTITIEESRPTEANFTYQPPSSQ